MISKERFIGIADALTRYSLTAALFLVPIYFAWAQENFTVFDLNKSVALHVLLTLAVAGWLAKTLLSGRIRRFDGRIGWPLVAVALLFLLSTVMSIHPLISLWGSYERQQGMYNLWHYLAFFFLAIDMLRDRRCQELFMRALLASTVVVCLYGLLQACGLDFFSWGQSSQSRIFSSFGQPNFLGHYLVVMIPLTLYAAAWLATSEKERLIYRMLLGLELACLLFTYSRSAWLAGLVTLMSFLIFNFWHFGKKKTALALGVLILFAVMVVSLSPLRSAVVNTAASLNIKGVERIVSIIDARNGSNQIRLLYWRAGIDHIMNSRWERVLFGNGPDTQASLYVRHYQPEWSYYESINSFPDRAHNFLLDIPLQFGFAGLAALGWFIWIIVSRLFKKFQRQSGREYWYGLSLLAALLAYGINNLFSFSLTSMSLMLYLLLALVWAAARSEEAANGTNEQIELTFFQPLSQKIVAAGIMLLLIALLYGYNFKPLMADYYYFQVKKAEARGDCRAVMDGMEQVMTWYPVSHYYSRAYLHHGTNCFSAATTDSAKQQLADNLLEEAEALPPRERQFYTLIDLAHLYSILGYYVHARYYPVAEELYQELLRQSPNITVTYQDYGRMKMWQAKYDEAIAMYEQGLAVTARTESRPDNEHTDGINSQRAYFHELIGAVYEYKKQLPEAEGEYRQALRDNPRQTSSLRKLSDLAYRRKDLKTAIEFNKQAYLIEPWSPFWPTVLATLYKESGDFKLALQYARESVERDPNNDVPKKIIEELEKK